MITNILFPRPTRRPPDRPQVLIPRMRLSPEIAMPPDPGILLGRDNYLFDPHLLTDIIHALLVIPTITDKLLNPCFSVLKKKS